MAQSKAKQLEKMGEMDELEVESSLHFSFNYKKTPAKIMLEAKEVEFGYDPTKPLFQNLSFKLEKGKCLAIIGKNGKGKSTLLNVLAGELPLQQGILNFHPETVFAHFGQTNIQRLNTKNSIIDEIYEVDRSNSSSIADPLLPLIMLYSPKSGQGCYFARVRLRTIAAPSFRDRNAMLATIVNALAVLAGSFLGLLFKRKLSERYEETVYTATGIISIVIGVGMALKATHTLAFALALILGGLSGSLLDVEGQVLRLGEALKRRFAKRDSIKVL